MICSSPCVFLFFSSSFRFVSRSLSLFRFVHVNVCISWCAASVGCFVVSFYLFNRHCFTHTHRASMWIGMHFFAAQRLCTQSVCVMCELLLLPSCCCCCFFRFIPFLLLTSFFSSSLDFFLGLSWRCMCSELREKVHIHMHLTYAILEIDWREEKKLYYWEKTAQKMCVLLFKRFVF